METLDMFKEMIKLQDATNTKTLGVDWRNVGIYNGKHVNWKRFIILEAAEAIDQSLDWKHWKKGKDDLDNLVVEIVDIIHFLMSLYLTKLADDVVADILDGIVVKDTKYDREEIILAFESLMKLMLIDNYEEQPKGWLNANNMVLSDIFSLAGITIPELYQRYIIKNALNNFRQNNGYKEGTYVKVIDDKEDNYWIGLLYAEGDTYDDIYTKYDAFYNKKISK